MVRVATCTSRLLTHSVDQHRHMITYPLNGLVCPANVWSAGRTACLPGRPLTRWLQLVSASWSQQQVRPWQRLNRYQPSKLVAAVLGAVTLNVYVEGEDTSI
jgi:hypothetical protein